MNLAHDKVAQNKRVITLSHECRGVTQARAM